MVLAPVGDTKDGRTEYLADRLEANAADRGELIRGQRGPPRAADRNATIRAGPRGYRLKSISFPRPEVRDKVRQRTTDR